MKHLLRIGLFVLLSTSLCHAGKEIPIAAIFSKTGEAAPISVEHLVIARFAVDEINRAGGVLGQHLNLLEIDNASSALGSRTAAREAISLNVAAVIGGSWSSHALGMAPELQRAGIPMISPTATNPAVTGVGDCIFRACFIDSFQGIMLAAFVHDDLKARRVAVVTNADQVYSMDLSRCFIDRFTRYPGTAVAEFDYIETIASFSSVAGQIVGYPADVVFLPGYARDSSHIIQAARNRGINSVFVGGDGWSHLMLNYSVEELNNTYFLTHWHKAMADDRSRAFVRKAAALFDESRINAGMALTYDAVYLLVDAMRRAGTSDPKQLRDALADTYDFTGVTGTIRFDASRNPVKPGVILRFRDGKTEVVKTVLP